MAVDSTEAVAQRLFQSTTAQGHHEIHGPDVLTDLIELLDVRLIALLEEFVDRDEVASLVVEVNQVRLHLELLDVSSEHHQFLANTDPGTSAISWVISWPGSWCIALMIPTSIVLTSEERGLTVSRHVCRDFINNFYLLPLAQHLILVSPGDDSIASLTSKQCMSLRLMLPNRRDDHIHVFVSGGVLTYLTIGTFVFLASL